MSSTFRIVQHTLPGQHIREYSQSSRHRQEDVHSIAIKQYIPLDLPDPVPDNAVTILGFHGNGFPKETYEPFFTDLHASLKQRNINIRSIWIADSSNQGASGVLNEYIQGDQTSWHDHARDVLHMVNHFRDQMPRPIIGVAHSYGCVQLVHLSTMHPRLLSTVILMEPIIFDVLDINGNPSPALRTLSRRDIWPTSEDANKSLRKAFGNWDSRCIDAYIKHGLRPVPTAVYNSNNNGSSRSSSPADKPLPNPLPDSAVTLTTTKAQESWTFVNFNGWPKEHDESDKVQRHQSRLLRPDQSAADEWSAYMVRPETRLALRELVCLRPSVLFVYGSNSVFAPEPFIQEKLAITGTGQGGSGGAKEGKVKSVVIQGANHLVTFEKAGLSPAVTACAEWIGTWFTEYLADEAFLVEYAARKEGRASDAESLRLSQEWVEQTRKPMGTLRPVKVKVEVKGKL